MSCLTILNWLCCAYMVIFNIIGIILSLVVLALGVLLVWGIQIAKSALGSTVTSLFDSISKQLNDLAGTSVDLNSLMDNISTVTGGMGAAFIILGCIILAVSIVGICAGCCGYKICLYIYVGVVSVMFIGQLIVVIIWFANSDILKRTIKTSMEDSVKEFTGISSKNIQSLLQNIIQIMIGCCGVSNGTDFYTLSTNWNRTYSVDNYTFQLTYPVTCCKFSSNFSLVNKYCPYNTTNTETSNYQKGCYTELFTYVDKVFKVDYIFYALSGILLIQILLAVGGIVRLLYKRKSSVKPV